MLTDEDRQWFSAQLHGFETSSPNNLYGQTGESFDPVGHRLDQFEARLVAEFRTWATRMELRQQAHAAALEALDAELASLEDRIKKLEDRRA